MQILSGLNWRARLRRSVITVTLMLLVGKIQMESQNADAGLNIPVVRPFAWSREAKPLAGLHRWLNGALVAWAVFSTAYAFLSAALYFALNDFENGLEPSNFQYWLFDIVSVYDGNLVLGISIFLFAFSGVFYCWFFYRAMRNLHLSSARGELMSSLGVVLWNFVPIAWLWLPRKAVGQIWRASTDPLRGRYDPPWVINLWWAAWLVSGVLSGIAQAIIVEENEIDNAQLLLLLEGVNSLLCVVVAFSLLPLARQIMIAQDKHLAEELARPVANPAPA